MKKVVTAEDVQAVPRGGEIVAHPAAVITDWAREVAATRGVRITVRAAVPDSGPGPTSIAVGSDHGGFPLKEEVKKHLGRLGFRFHDFGTHSPEPVDYPDVARTVAGAVQRGEARLGILVDGAGLGSAMAANKLRGIRAAPCTDARAAKNAREHNDANVLTLGSGFVDVAGMQEIVEVFLTASCTEERHRRRVEKIGAIEAEQAR
jgi:RpiB/LacA/LacB family sugar-phosphate isomerase